MFDLTGRVALVTGAGQGMGVGIAEALAEQGAAVIVNDLDEGRAQSTTTALVDAGQRAVAAPFDVTDGDGAAAAIAIAAAEVGGPVDILVNNAGVPVGMDLARFQDMDPDEWRRYVDLNIYGSLHCIRAVLDGMVDRRWGRVIQISSGAGHQGLPLGISMYGASKAGAEGFIRHLASEVARSGVTANAVALGLMANSLEGVEGKDTGPDSPMLASIAKTVPVGRLGTPADVGAAVAFLASDEASWVTAQTMHVNGGSF